MDSDEKLTKHIARTSAVIIVIASVIMGGLGAAAQQSRIIAG